MYLQADLDHIALDCKDAETQLAFYTNVLGFAPCRVEEFRAGKAPFPSVRTSASTILDFFQSDEGGGLKGANHFCMAIEKDAFPALKTRLENASVHVPEPVLRSGARGDGLSVYIRDPEANLLEFRWYM